MKTLRLVVGLGLLCIPSLVFGNPAHHRLIKLDAKQRNEALTLVMTEEDCGAVIKNFFQGQAPDGTANWNVKCSNGRAFGISIQNDAKGSTRVLDCAILKVVADVECFKKY